MTVTFLCFSADSWFYLELLHQWGSRCFWSEDCEDKGEAKETRYSRSLDAKMGFLFSLDLFTVRSSANSDGERLSRPEIYNKTRNNTSAAQWWNMHPSKKNRGLEKFPSENMINGHQWTLNFSVSFYMCSRRWFSVRSCSLKTLWHHTHTATGNLPFHVLEFLLFSLKLEWSLGLMFRCFTVLTVRIVFPMLTRHVVVSAPVNIVAVCCPGEIWRLYVQTGNSVTTLFLF